MSFKHIDQKQYLNGLTPHGLLMSDEQEEKQERQPRRK
jgi:hypothetical protein